MARHDEALPLGIRSRSTPEYFELLVKAMYASAGAAAAATLRWADIREAFESFEPERLASYSTGQMEVLVDDPRLGGDDELIEAVVGNAEAMMAIIAEQGSFDQYLRDNPSGDQLTAAFMRDFHGLDRAGAELYVRLLQGGDGRQADLGLERSA